jgi:hypothetical protein
MLIMEHFSPKLNLIFSLPDNWIEYPSKEVSLFFVGPKEVNYTPNMAIDVWQIENIQANSYLQAAEVASARMKANYNAAADSQELKLDSYRNISYTFSWMDQVSRLEAVQIHLYVQLDDRIFWFNFNTIGELKDRYLPLFKNIISSIRFLPQSRQIDWTDKVFYSKSEKPEKNN